MIKAVVYGTESAPAQKQLSGIYAEFEIVKYKLMATDSGLGDANKFDDFDLTIMPNSVEAPSLYKAFGESETFTGELQFSEITIERSER